MHGYILCFSYDFKVCSKSVSEILYIHPVIVDGAVITHEMFDAGTKHLSATDGQLKIFLSPSEWRSSIFKVQFSCTFTSVTTSNPPKCIIDTTDIQKTPDVSYIYFLGQWFVEIKLKKLSIITCVFVSNSVARCWYKMVATPCSKHGIWLGKVILLVSLNIGHLLLPNTKKMWWKEFLLQIDQSLNGSSKFGHVGVFVNCVLQHKV